MRELKGEHHHRVVEISENAGKCLEEEYLVSSHEKQQVVKKMHVLQLMKLPLYLEGGWAVVFDTEEKANRPAKCGVDRGAADPGLRWASEIVPGVERYLEAGKWRQQTFARGSAGTSYRKKLDLWKVCTKKKEERHLFRLPFPILLLIVILD